MNLGRSGEPVFVLLPINIGFPVAEQRDPDDEENWLFNKNDQNFTNNVLRSYYTRPSNIPITVNRLELHCKHYYHTKFSSSFHYLLSKKSVFERLPKVLIQIIFEFCRSVSSSNLSTGSIIFAHINIYI
jgi:hypothetical protein